MKGTKSAVRYAKALLDLAIEKNMVDAVLGDMRYFYETYKDSRDLHNFLNNPVINATKKVEVLKEVFGQFETLTMSFVELIAKNGRENILPEIAASFEAQVKEFKGIVPVELVSAVALDASTKNNILAKVEASVKGTLEVTETVDPSIIGGFIVKMGDRRIDASVASQINKLKQSLTH